MTRRDPVTPELRENVFRRDAAKTGWSGIGPLCVAPFLDDQIDRAVQKVHPSPCGVARVAGPCGGRTTLDHIQDGYGRMGKRAPSDAAHLVSLCENHHLWTGWATAHRPELRAYLASVEGKTRP